MTWTYTPADALTVKRWSEKVNRDAEKSLFWAPMMYGSDGTAMRHPDYNKFKGIIKVHTDFQGKTGDRVTLPNIARLTGRGTHGDQLLRGAGGTLSTYSMDLFFENIAHQVISGGKLSERRIAMNFRQEGRTALGDWMRRKVEESIVLALWGLTTWNNSVLDNFNNSGESSVLLNTIQAFDSDHIVYGGDATSDGDIDSSDVLTAQLITKIETKAREDLSIPVEPMVIDGQECYALIASGRAIENLRYDQDWKDAQALMPRNTDNPLIKRAIGKYGKTYVIEYPKCLNPAANVSRGIFCGKDALHFAKVEEAEMFEDFADDAKRRVALSIGAAYGVAPAYFNSTRRNAIAVDTYVRS